MAQRKKLFLMPLFSFASTVSTFLDRKKFDILFTEPNKLDFKEDQFINRIDGEWCYPIKQMISLINYATSNLEVDIVISPFVNSCKFPVACGSLENLIGKDKDYLPIEFNYPTISLRPCIELFTQLSKLDVDFNILKFLYKFPLAFYRYNLSRRMYQSYLSTIPYMDDPISYKLQFVQIKNTFVLAPDYQKSKQISDKFIDSNRLIVEKKKSVKLKRVLLTGDFSMISSMEFPIFEYDVFLARKGMLIVKPEYPATIFQYKYSRYARQVSKLFSEFVTNRYNTVLNKKDGHLFEFLTLYHIIEGIDKGVDGIIFVKPNMCSPCDNISYILKKINYFGKSFLEVSYDDQTGISGIITRIEAFQNILSEKGK